MAVLLKCLKLELPETIHTCKLFFHIQTIRRYSLKFISPEFLSSGRVWWASLINKNNFNINQTVVTLTQEVIMKTFLHIIWPSLNFSLARLIILLEPKPLSGWSHILFSIYLKGLKINLTLAITVKTMIDCQNNYSLALCKSSTIIINYIKISPIQYYPFYGNQFKLI